MEALYDVYFKGEILEGFAEAEVKAKLAQLFKADDAKIAQLFSGKACVIKKDIDKATALKYQQAMKNAGAKPLIIPKSDDASVATTVSSPAPAPAPVTAATAGQTPSPVPITTPATGDDKWDVLPAGSDVLKPDERQAFTEANIDTSHIHMASAFAEPSVATAPPPPAPDTSHLSVAEVGADINPEVPLPVATVELDFSGISVAEPGAQLVEAKPDAPSPALDLSAISLAEPGATLGDSNKPAPPPAPDTSHLSLDK